jgi:hypothetical protein
MDDPRIAQARERHQRDEHTTRLHGNCCLTSVEAQDAHTDRGVLLSLLTERDQEAEAQFAHAERIAELELRERSVLASFAEAQQEIARLQALLKARVTHP